MLGIFSIEMVHFKSNQCLNDRKVVLGGRMDHVEEISYDVRNVFILHTRSLGDLLNVSSQQDPGVLYQL